MKKTLLVLAFGLALMTACKKDRVCECREGNSIDRVEYKKVTRKWMINTAECVSYTYTDNQFIGTDFNGNPIYQDVSVNVDCEIK